MLPFESKDQFDLFCSEREYDDLIANASAEMLMDKVKLGIQCSVDIAEQLAAELAVTSQAPVDQVELDNLDGTPTTSLQLVQVAVSLISAVAPIVAAYIARNGVKRIKLGEIEIDNPTQEQWESIWNEYVSDRPGRVIGGSSG